MLLKSIDLIAGFELAAEQVSLNRASLGHRLRVILATDAQKLYICCSGIMACSTGACTRYGWKW